MIDVKKHIVSLHPAQAAFRKSQARFRGFVGGRSAGKSFVGAFDMLMRASAVENKGRLYMVCSPTYGMLRDASMRSFEQIGNELGLIKDIRRGADNMSATLVNDAEVLFRSGDEPDRLRGPNLSGVWLDEASQLAPEAFNIVIACLRERGQAGWLSATFTPKGKQHWTYTEFGSNRPDAELFHATSRDNPFNPKDFEHALRARYTSHEAAQEIDGHFTDLAGSLFRRHWFEIVEVPPATIRQRIRAWDLASTEPGKGNKDPDYTVGVLLGKSQQGIFYILDVRRDRLTPAGVEQLVRHTAMVDGRQTKIVIEREGGSAGQAWIAVFVKLLAGFDIRGDRPTGEKSVRASPLAAQAEAGNVKLLRGDWNKAFLDEMEVFPVSSSHDDQVDAAALAFAKLTGSSSSTGSMTHYPVASMGRVGERSYTGGSPMTCGGIGSGSVDPMKLAAIEAVGGAAGLARLNISRPPTTVFTGSGLQLPRR